MAKKLLLKSLDGRVTDGEPSEGRGRCEGWIRRAVTPTRDLRPSASPSAVPSPPALQQVVAFTTSSGFSWLFTSWGEETGEGDAMSQGQSAERGQKRTNDQG